MTSLLSETQHELIAEFIATQHLNITQLREYCNQVEKTISVVWCIEDVHQANEDLDNRVLSDEEAWQILSELEQSCDEVNWDSIRWHIERYFTKQSWRSDADAKAV